MNPKLISFLKSKEMAQLYGARGCLRMQKLKLPGHFSLSLGITGDSEPQNHWITEQSGLKARGSP